jgi:hypothetical protein
MAAQMFSVDPGEYVLYKVDWEDDPLLPLKNGKRTMKKEGLNSGSMLILKNKKEVMN